MSDPPPHQREAASGCSLPEALSDIEQALPRFARWLYTLVRADLGQRVLDAGAGLGTYAELMVGDGKVVVALEPDASFVQVLRDRFIDQPAVRVRQGDLADAGALRGLGPFDSALCLNVLEHVQNDVQALQNMRETVAEGGTLVLLVPAYRWLFNKMDRGVGHYRRYGKSELLEKLQGSGWDVERCFRFNVFGVGGWFVAGSVLRRDHPGEISSVCTTEWCRHSPSWKDTWCEGWQASVSLQSVGREAPAAPVRTSPTG